MERSSNHGGEGREKVRNILLLLPLAFLVSPLSCNDQPAPAESPPPAVVETPSSPLEGPAGEIFGVPVSVGSYRFAEAVVKVFGRNIGGRENTSAGLEEKIWDELVMNYEAVVRRGIEAPREDIEQEIDKTLKKASVDWRNDRAAYEAWLKGNTGVSIEMFENMIGHMIKVKTVRQQVLDGIEPEVSEEEAFQEFLNEHNTLSIELVQFDDAAGAAEFHRNATAKRAFWDAEKAKDEKKEKTEQRFKRPGFVALEFLMHMWQLPKKAVYDMIDMKVGSIYPPTPIYKGQGVFKVLEIRRAEKEDFPKRRESYMDQVKVRKKFDGFKTWLDTLKEEARIKKSAKPLGAGTAS